MEWLVSASVLQLYKSSLVQYLVVYAYSGWIIIPASYILVSAYIRLKANCLEETFFILVLCIQ